MKNCLDLKSLKKLKIQDLKKSPKTSQKNQKTTENQKLEEKPKQTT
jgi:hypothetical protein